MSMTIIRKMTDEDKARLAAAEKRFVRNHGLSEQYIASDEIAYAVEHDARIARLWASAMCRAFRVRYDRNITIGWGSIGIAEARS